MLRKVQSLCLLTALFVGAASFVHPVASNALPNQPLWSADPVSDSFVYEVQDGAIECRPALPDEAQAMNTIDHSATLHVISDLYQPQAAGAMNIILRGTTQLDGFPQARDAFLRAAESWKARVEAPITVVIDVDFGPTRFGQTFPQGVLGSTSTQSLFTASGYPSVRSGLVSRTSGFSESTVINALPQSQVPTDIGNTAGVSAPSAALRTLGIIGPVADPSSESQYGNPPSIGFNSNFAFDFDPSNGIDADKIDFDAVATHEIGHALGFTSRVGALESNPTTQLGVTLLDLYRFRPGTTMTTFTDAQRILSSGGQQSFFAGPPELAMSTGRQDGTGGDRNQASHWKDERIVSPPIGIMVPAITNGERHTINDNDVLALKMFGYTAAGSSSGDGGDPGGPTVKKVSYDGETMTIKGSDFGGNLQLEVNDVIVGPPLKIKVKGSGGKLKIAGSQAELNLHAGANRVRVIADGLRSAVKTLSL
jgi:hypothetical protein